MFAAKAERITEDGYRKHTLSSVYITTMFRDH